MKKLQTSILSLFFILALAALYGKAEDFNLKGPEKRVLEVKGNEYVIWVYKYDPPYLAPPYLIENPSQTDCSIPESALIALHSAADRNIPWYLSLFDEYSQKWLKEQGWLSEELKGKPIGNRIKEGNFFKFLYKVEYILGGNDYQVLMGTRFTKHKPSKVFSSELFIKQDNRWLKTLLRKGNPFLLQIGFCDYDELMKISRPFDGEKK